MTVECDHAVQIAHDFRRLAQTKTGCWHDVNSEAVTRTGIPHGQVAAACGTTFVPRNVTDTLTAGDRYCARCGHSHGLYAIAYLEAPLVDAGIAVFDQHEHYLPIIETDCPLVADDDETKLDAGLAALGFCRIDDWERASVGYRAQVRAIAHATAR